MIKKVTKILYLLIIITQIMIIKTYNNNYQNSEDLKIETKSVDYQLNKYVNPNIKSDDSKKEQDKIIDYEIILEIPKIKLKKGILNKKNKDNNIEKNVTILNESKYPNEEGNVFLAAHSGNGKKSFFNDLVQLNISDKIYLYYQNQKYIYSIVEIKEVNKNQQLSLLTKNKNNLVLITCSQRDKSKYLVLISYKINK